MPPTPLDTAKLRVRQKFDQSLAGTPMEPAAWAHYDQVFLATIALAFNTYGAPYWQEDRVYVLKQVALIARLARYYAKKDGNSAQIKKQHLADAIETGIEQARFECDLVTPGRSCENYQGG